MTCAAGSALFASPAEAAFACNSSRSTTNSPYSQSKFTTVIEKSKLQLPDSSTCIANAQLKDYYYDADNWYVDNSNMVFAIDNGSAAQRNELRGNSFAGNRTNMQWAGRVKMTVGSGFSSGFTVGQIYGETGGEPILRVEMIGSRSGVTNHLWGIYRTSVGSGATFEYQDLGPAPADFTDLTLLYNTSGTITAKLGTNPTRTWTTNLSYYTTSSKTTYFKAGCYLQNAGDCYVKFSTLRFDS
ncbi:MAG: polysaccharide lyase family 7 protein [Pseudomonadota bacterium]